jgi:tetratricopeptide (TPR) repeat protein
MYLSGSKWNMRKKRRHANPWRVLLLLVLIATALYFLRFIVPTVPTPFVQTPTPTRSPASYVLEAESLFQSGKLGQAEESYRKAIEVDPDDPGYYVALARLQVFQGEFVDAETNARNALLLQPDLPVAHAVLGWALDFQGGDKLIEAQLAVERALELDPNLALAHAYYAEVLMDNDLGNYEAALLAAQKAADLDPNLLEAHRSLGYVWERTQNYDRALQEYQTALRINPNLSMLHVAVGNMALNQDDTNGAIDSYLKASTLNPDSTEPLTLIAQAYARVGEYGKASQYAANAVEKDPANALLHGNLGRMYYKNNEFGPAVEELTLAVRGGTTSGGVQVEGLPLDVNTAKTVEFYYTYGLALAKSGSCDLATEIFQALLRAVPDDEIAVTNATEGLVLCGVIEPTPTPRPTSAP